jgi:hypothetical protein
LFSNFGLRVSINFGFGLSDFFRSFCRTFSFSTRDLTTFVRLNTAFLRTRTGLELMKGSLFGLFSNKNSKIFRLETCCCGRNLFDRLLLEKFDAKSSSQSPFPNSSTLEKSIFDRPRVDDFNFFFFVTDGEAK